MIVRTAVTQVRPHLLFLFACAALFAQEPTIRVDVQQVLVPVVVTDKKGHHVTGLRASDFRILEDGVAQEIASFSSDTAASAGDLGALSRPAAGGAAAPAPASARHTFVICLDTLHSAPANAPRIQQALENVFEKEKSTGAQYVLMAIGRQLQVLEPATANPLALLVKVRSAAFRNSLSGMDASARAAQLQNIRARMDEICKHCACGARSNQGNCDSEIDTLKQSVDAEAERWNAPTKELLEQFKSVVEELAKLPTGRTLILISEGFSADPRREFYAAVSAYLPNRPQFKLEDSAGDPTLRAALQIAADRNVIIDTIDSRTGTTAPLAASGAMDAGSSGAAAAYGDVVGINRPRTPAARAATLENEPGTQLNALSLEGSATMEEISKTTGGLYYHASGDLGKDLHGALADGREYYVLAYVPKNSASDGKYRTITVETADKKLTIRAKPGYWASGAAQ